MELQGEDGSIIEFPESLERDLGRGPGIASNDKTVSRRQVRLKLQPIPKGNGRSTGFNMSLEVIGPNPVCVIHVTDRGKSLGTGRSEEEKEVIFVKNGMKRFLKAGDRFSLSIQEPSFYSLREPIAREDLVASGLSRGSEAERNGGIDNVETDGHVKTNVDDRGFLLGAVAVDEAGLGSAVDEEEGIAEAVARWQRRRRERMGLEDRKLHEGSASVRMQTKDGMDGIEQVAGTSERLGSNRKDEMCNTDVKKKPGLADLQGTVLDNIDPRKFGFLVEGSEFEQYGKKRLNAGKWEWQIGKRGASGDDDEDENRELSHDQRKQHKQIAAGAKAKAKAGHTREDVNADDDDWEGDSEGEREPATSSKKLVPQKLQQQAQSHNHSSASDTMPVKRDTRNNLHPRLKNEVEDPELEKVENLRAGHGQVRASTVGGQRSKSVRRGREDEGGDLNGFLVDDVEEDEEEVEDEDDEFTDEEDSEDDDGTDEMEEASNQPSGSKCGPTTRQAKEKNGINVDKPMCKYGSKCFRKNKDHLAEFRH